MTNADPFNRFARTRIAARGDARVPAGKMYAAYVLFYRQVGARAIELQRFTAHMMQRGYQLDYFGGIAWADVELRPALALVPA